MFMIIYINIIWSLKSIDCIQLRINKVNPFKGGNTYLDLPSHIKKKKHTYSILSKYDSRLNKSRFNKKYFDIGLNFKCIDFPTPITQLKKFEKINNMIKMFIRSQRTKNCSKLIICKKCFTSFGNKPCKSKLRGESGLIRHKQMCIKNKLGRPITFEEGDDDFIYFKNYKNTQRIPIFEIHRKIR
ncbi:Uncharacterized protein FWK35_00005277 [Aphis craccivora]|uniref:Uncharacterized protein n=1 Tax=Aphis craccivora TaxID=307492 RepID=A0A6G0YJH4_APHCR|nr:Uncharacterized protein FWK35_00005277 [Aphis craccivora]